MGKRVYTLPVAVKIAHKFWRNTLDKGVFSKFILQDHQSIVQQFQTCFILWLQKCEWDEFIMSMCGPLFLSQYLWNDMHAQTWASLIDIHKWPLHVTYKKISHHVSHVHVLCTKTIYMGITNCLHCTISKHCCWVAFPIFHGVIILMQIFDENNYVPSGYIIRAICYKMRRVEKWRLWMRLINFASLNYRYVPSVWIKEK